MIVSSAQSFIAILTLLSAFGYLAAAFITHKRERVGRSGAFLLSTAAILHAAVLVIGLTSPPRFGFGPALSMSAWFALAAYGFESMRYRLQQLRWRLAVIGAVAVVLAWVFPGAELPAQGRIWMPLHLAFGMCSYGMLIIAVMHAWLMSGAEQRMRNPDAMLNPNHQTRLPLLTLERLTFEFLLLGFVLLTITIVQAMVFEVAGSWTWSHKTIFTLLSWVVFAVLLWGHWQRGWRGRRTVRAIYAGAVLLLLGYAGSHFVMEVLLHRATST